MRVLHISSLWPPRVLGGAEVYASQLAAALERAGHDVGLVTFGVPDPKAVRCVPPWPYRLEEFADQPPWRKAAFRLVDVYNPVAARMIKQAIGDFKPDVVHSHSVAGLSTVAVTGSSRVGPAHVHHLHDYWLLCRRATPIKASGEPCATRCRSCALISSSRSLMLERHPPDLLLAPSAAIAKCHFYWPGPKDAYGGCHIPSPPRPGPGTGPLRRREGRSPSAIWANSLATRVCTPCSRRSKTWPPRGTAFCSAAAARYWRTPSERARECALSDGSTKQGRKRSSPRSTA